MRKSRKPKRKTSRIKVTWETVEVPDADDRLRGVYRMLLRDMLDPVRSGKRREKRQLQLPLRKDTRKN